MSDIAQRLLDGGNDICRYGLMWPGNDMLEGAAEITRLRALVDELKADRIRINDEAETEIKRLREALKFYADESIYSDWFRHDDNDSTAERDGGQRARKALEAK